MTESECIRVFVCDGIVAGKGKTLQYYISFNDFVVLMKGNATNMDGKGKDGNPHNTHKLAQPEIALWCEVYFNDSVEKDVLESLTDKDSLLKSTQK